MFQYFTNIYWAHMICNRLMLPNKMGYIYWKKSHEIDFSFYYRYSYGENVKGAYHCQFGVVANSRAHVPKIKPVFIRGLELTGSVRKLKPEMIWYWIIICLDDTICRHLLCVIRPIDICFFLQAPDGTAEVSQSIAKINDELKKEMNRTLFDLRQEGAQLYIRVFVTNIQSKI